MYPSTLSPLSHDDALIAQAEELLRRPGSLGVLTAEEARCIVSYMRLVHAQEGAVLTKEGDADHSDHMLLVLEGEVSVESLVANRSESVVLTVMGVGSLVGEMGLIDGAPRAATCIALSPIIAAALSRSGLARLLADDPTVAAKLLMAISQRMAERLRDSGRQQRVFSQLVRAMQGEIDELNRQLQMVMDGAAARQSLRPGSSTDED